MELIFYIAIFIIVSGLIMIATNILYDLASIVVPILAIIMVIVGIIVGLVVALKNTFIVYKEIYTKKGK